MKRLERRLELTGRRPQFFLRWKLGANPARSGIIGGRLPKDSPRKPHPLRTRRSKPSRRMKSPRRLRAEEPKLVLRERLEQAVLLRRERDGLREELIRLDAREWTHAKSLME